MNVTHPVSIRTKIQPSRIELVLALLDLVIGVAILALCAWTMTSLLRPSDPVRDNAVVGGLGIAMLLPFGLAALAAFDAMRFRAKGRWILQTLALVPPLFIGCIVAFQQSSSPLLANER